MTADKRRIAACLKACEGISTQNLEDNVPVLELALRYNAVLREREALLDCLNEWKELAKSAEKKCDALTAEIEARAQQEPVAWTTKLALEFGASRLGFQVSGVNIWGENGVPLYALPGAKGEEK